MFVFVPSSLSSSPFSLSIFTLILITSFQRNCQSLGVYRNPTGSGGGGSSLPSFMVSTSYDFLPSSSESANRYGIISTSSTSSSTSSTNSNNGESDHRYGIISNSHSGDKYTIGNGGIITASSLSSLSSNHQHPTHHRVGSDENPKIFRNNHKSRKRPFLSSLLKLTTSPGEDGYDLLGESSSFLNHFYHRKPSLSYHPHHTGYQHQSIHHHSNSNDQNQNSNSNDQNQNSNSNDQNQNQNSYDQNQNFDNFKNHHDHHSDQSHSKDTINREDFIADPYWSSGGTSSSTSSSEEVTNGDDNEGGSSLLYRPSSTMVTTMVPPTTLYPPYLTSPKSVAIITRRRNPPVGSLPSFMVSTSYDSTGTGYGNGNKYNTIGNGIITSSGLIKTPDSYTHKNNHIHFGTSISSNIYKPSSSHHSPSISSQSMKVSTPTSIVSVVSKPSLKVTSVQGNKYKDPDDIQSASLTVLDPTSDSSSIVSNTGSSSSSGSSGSSSSPFGSSSPSSPFSWMNQRLRPNVTIVHDKLIVAYKPGRPLPPPSLFPPQASQSPPVSSSSISSVGTILNPMNPIKENSPYTTRKPYNFTGSMDWILGSGSEVFNSTSEPDTVSTYYPFIPQTSYPPNRVTSQWPTYDPNILNDFTTTPATTGMTAADTQPVTVTFVTTTPSTTSTQSTTPSSTSVSYPSVSTQSNSGNEVIAIVTKKPYFPSATVNAILAPPMPSRPISTPAPLGNTGIFSNLLSLAGVSGPGGIMNRLTLLKTALFTLLVMFLPPLTLAAAVAQLL